MIETCTSKTASFMFKKKHGPSDGLGSEKCSILPRDIKENLKSGSQRIDASKEILFGNH